MRKSAKDLDAGGAALRPCHTHCLTPSPYTLSLSPTIYVRLTPGHECAGEGEDCEGRGARGPRGVHAGVPRLAMACRVRDDTARGPRETDESARAGRGGRPARAVHAPAPRPRVVTG